MKIHRFEESGLGKAPFRVIGFEYRVGPIRMPNGSEIGAPGQPMGTCDYCRTGIANCFLIQSADGKRFIVGSECVRKTDDKGLKTVVEAKIRELNRNARHSREQQKIDELKRWLANPEVIEYLKTQADPSGRNPSLYDKVNWYMVNAGNSGKLAMRNLVSKKLNMVTQ